MSKISEIDELLSDPNYVYDDGFWVFYEIAIDLQEHEWISLIELGKSKSKDWNENLLYAEPFKHGQIEEVLPCVFSTIKNNKELAIFILSQLDSGALSETLNEEHIMELAEVWKAEPKLRESVKITLREAQKAGILRKYLGLNNWKEASVKYPVNI